MPTIFTNIIKELLIENKILKERINELEEQIKRKVFPYPLIDQ